MKVKTTLLCFLLGCLGWLPASPISESGDSSIQLISNSAGVSGGGGVVGAGNISAVVSTGSAISGGINAVATIRENGGFTGNLYDPVSLALSATPGTNLNEGQSAELSARVRMDDLSTLPLFGEVTWSVLTGPMVVTETGIAVALGGKSGDVATVRGTLDLLAGDIDFTIQDLPYKAYPLTWSDPTMGGNPPYDVYLGTDSGSLEFFAQSNQTYLDFGKLDMGTEYFFQVFDASGNNITPGGPGAGSFVTTLFQPDLGIGSRGNPSTHRGNNSHNLSGAGQTESVTTLGAKKAKLYFSVQNDGDGADDFLLQGSRANRKFKFVKYFQLSGGRRNVTASMIRTGYGQMDVDPGAVSLFQVQAKPNGKKRASQTLKILAVSKGDSRGADLAKGKVKGLVKKK